MTYLINYEMYTESINNTEYTHTHSSAQT